MNRTVPEKLSALLPVRGFGIDEVARLARDQRGFVSRVQLNAAGYDREAIARMVRKRQLVKVQSGVFAFGAFAPKGPLIPETIAAMRMDGVGVLSHLSAAKLWGITDLVPQRVNVTLVGRVTFARVDGVVIHSSGDLDPGELRRCQGLPVTSPARTLRDCVAIASDLEFEGMLALVRKRKLARDTQIEEVIERAPRNWPGIARFRAIYAMKDSVADSRSLYERKVLKLLAEADLPRPQTNVDVAGHMVDLYWPEQNLVVEFDSWTFHHDRNAFETDRLRDQRLIAIGKRVQRITARQVDDTPLALVSRLASALAIGGREAPWREQAGARTEAQAERRAA